MILTMDILQQNTEKQLKRMALAKSIEKPSKVLKSSSGLLNEIKFSRYFHQVGIPLLVSSALLRKRNLGQLDLGRLRKDHEGWLIEVGEVKSSEVGELHMSLFQKNRLYAAQRFLSGLFGLRSKLIRLIG